MSVADVTDYELISPEKLPTELWTTKREIAEGTGIAPQSLSCDEWVHLNQLKPCCETVSWLMGDAAQNHLLGSVPVGGRIVR